MIRKNQWQSKENRYAKSELLETKTKNANKQTNKKTVETNTKWSKNIYLEDAELPEVKPSHPNLQLLNVIPTDVTLSLRNIRVNCKRDQWGKIFLFRYLFTRTCVDLRSNYHVVITYAKSLAVTINQRT